MKIIFKSGDVEFSYDGDEYNDMGSADVILKKINALGEQICKSIVAKKERDPRDKLWDFLDECMVCDGLGMVPMGIYPDDIKSTQCRTCQATGHINPEFRSL